MRWPTSAMIGVLLTFAPPAQAAPNTLQGTWTAAEAERDGKAAEDLLGHRLSVAGNGFKIRSKDGKLLFAGRIRTNPKAKPASIDFAHKDGALKGKAWKGIYAFAGDTLKICDNAVNLEKGRPATFQAQRGSGYVLITFERVKP